jgi:hypothetical protein
MGKGGKGRMSATAFGVIVGIILGLLISVVIDALILPPDVAYEHVTLDGQAFDCVSWRDELVCEPAQAAAPLAGAANAPGRVQP